MGLTLITHELAQNRAGAQLPAHITVAGSKDRGQISWRLSLRGGPDGCVAGDEQPDDVSYPVDLATRASDTLLAAAEQAGRG